MMKKFYKGLRGRESIFLCLPSNRSWGSEQEGGRNWVGYSEMISLIRNGPYCDISEPLG